MTNLERDGLEGYWEPWDDMPTEPETADSFPGDDEEQLVFNFEEN